MVREFSCFTELELSDDTSLRFSVSSTDPTWWSPATAIAPLYRLLRPEISRFISSSVRMGTMEEQEGMRMGVDEYGLLRLTTDDKSSWELLRKTGILVDLAWTRLGREEEERSCGLTGLRHSPISV